MIRAAAITATAIVLAACADAVGPSGAAPGSGPSLARSAGPAGSGGAGKVTICHAAGRAGTTKFVEITVSRNAVSAHLGDNGTNRAGHEQDFIVTADRPCPTGMQVTKTFVGAMDEHMEPLEPHMGMYTLEQGTTVWLRYRIDYVGTGTLSDDIAAACATLNAYNNWGGGFTCTTAGFDGVGGTSMPVTGSGSVYIIIDIRNDSGCGDRPFVNTAVLTPSGSGQPVSGTTPAIMLWTPDCG